MPTLLWSSTAGRKRLVALAFVITLVFIYLAQFSNHPISTPKVDPSNQQQRPDAQPIGGKVGQQEGYGDQERPQETTIIEPTNNEEQHVGAAGAANTNIPLPGADDYRGHEYNPLQPTQDAATPPPKASVDANRWDEQVVGQPTASSPGRGAATETGEPLTSGAPGGPQCASYASWLSLGERTRPPSKGKRKFPYMRPEPECRTFNLSDMEDVIASMKTRIRDPDLFRLFENSFPNTLDTMIKWRGFANDTDAKDIELTYVITGDIDAMWLRDSASQIYSYRSLLKPSDDPNSLASLWRGVINAHARYITISPYCHAFQPPPESGISPTFNGANAVNHPSPSFNPSQVFDCKWELDSLAFFLQISAEYYQRTKDLKFFTKYVWVQAVQAAVSAASAMRLGTYAENGAVEASAYTFFGQTTRGSETLTNNGLGNPVRANGMVRSSFRPSDDATIFQHLVPSNMMWAKYLEEASHIMAALQTPDAHNTTRRMRAQAFEIRRGIARDAVVKHAKYGDIFAYEIDGYGGANLMDDANVPSLLSIPLFNYTHTSISEHQHLGMSLYRDDGVRAGAEDSLSSRGPTVAEEELAAAFAKLDAPPSHDYNAVYQNTRRFVLSPDNPYFMHGSAISAVGGPHIGPGHAWPMAAIVAAMTACDPLSYEGAESNAVASSRTKGRRRLGRTSGPDRKFVGEQLRMLLDTTSGKGLIHESVNTQSTMQFTRPWFGWANGLFGELVLKIAELDEQLERSTGHGQQGLGVSVEVGAGMQMGLLGKSWQD